MRLCYVDASCIDKRILYVSFAGRSSHSSHIDGMAIHGNTAAMSGAEIDMIGSESILDDHHMPRRMTDHKRMVMRLNTLRMIRFTAK